MYVTVYVIENTSYKVVTSYRVRHNVHHTEYVARGTSLTSQKFHLCNQWEPVLYSHRSIRLSPFCGPSDPVSLSCPRHVASSRNCACLGQSHHDNGVTTQKSIQTGFDPIRLGEAFAAISPHPLAGSPPTFFNLADSAAAGREIFPPKTALSSLAFTKQVYPTDGSC